MDFHGVWDDQTGLSPRLLRPPVEGVDGGVRVCVPFPKAVVWHSYGTVDCATKNGKWLFISPYSKGTYKEPISTSGEGGIRTLGPPYRESRI